MGEGFWVKGEGEKEKEKGKSRESKIQNTYIFATA